MKEITVADPSRELSRILITLPNIYKTKAAGITCYPDENNNKTMIIMDLPQGVYLGETLVINYKFEKKCQQYEMDINNLCFLTHGLFSV